MKMNRKGFSLVEILAVIVIVGTLSFFAISFQVKFNCCNFLKSTFSNTLISEILFQLKSNCYNCLKSTFSKALISDILFLL